MTESETIEALSEISINGITYLSVFISVTFAYLTVTYLVGRTLTKIQCIAVSALYVLFASMTAIATVGWSEAWMRLREREESVIDDIWLFENMQWLYWQLPMLTLVVLASLWFMWDVRRRS